MTDTDLIVPIEVHALVANYAVANHDSFRRWRPRFARTFSDRHRYHAEPGIEYSEGRPGEGIHIQWQLPEALATGVIDQRTGESRFPLVPNRWLVVRYAEVRGRLRTAGFLVHSDYLETADSDTDVATTPFVDPDAPRAAWIGRVHPLTEGPWEEAAARPPFLTAIGSGLPAFAAFAPYHENVFSFRDTLADLKENENYPPPCTVSYLVLGWYSSDDADILRTAAGIEGLLPPEADPARAADVLAALGWAAPPDMPDTVARTRYAGTVLGVTWDREGGHLPSDRPDGDSVTVAVGHSTADAVAALTAHRTGSARTGDLVRALFTGSPDELDDPDRRLPLDDITRRSWFSAHDGGAAWQVVNRPQDGADAQQPPPAQPSWVARLNRDQDAYDRALRQLDDAQWRLWSLWWLRNLPENRRPHDYAFDPAEWDREIARAESQVATAREALAAVPDVPHGTTPEEVQAAIDAYAQRMGLAPELELKRSPQRSYYRPADPVLALSGHSVTPPLGRDEDDPLPLRLPSRLLTRVKINDRWTERPSSPSLPPNADGLPTVLTPLLAEFALLDQAVRTTATGDGSTGRTALHAILADPDGRSEGPWPEYTRVWRQPWLPLYLQWELKHCATPYQDESGVQRWEFDGERYRWQGGNAAPGDGTGGRRWTAFGGRAFLTPATRHVLREQARRLADNAPAELAAPLRALRGALTEVDVLSQSLDGFHDWLIQQDGAAQAVTDPAVVAQVGQTNHVPDGAEDRRRQRFQPVRGGQFHFVELVIIDRFGRECRLVEPVDSQIVQFAPVRADSVRPDAELYQGVAGPQRFIQLPPRIIQPARLRLETVAPAASQPPRGLEATGDPADSPVIGWLLVNHLDRTLLVHGPDGEPLGELRVIHDAHNTPRTAWNPLPHAPFPHPDDPGFAAAHPHLVMFARELLAHAPDAFEALTATIDTALDHIVEPSPAEDRSPARLIGRPLALIRTRLGLDLQGAPLTNPAWDHALNPPEEDYPDHRWTVRLGDPDRLADGLIGYFAADDHDQPTDYTRLHAVEPAGPASPYITAVGTGAHLTLPARPADRPATHHLTLLACPHTAVHATTDILPVAELALDADATHRALARIRASFRLNPLLAPDGFPDKEEAGARAGVAPVPPVAMPRPAARHGSWTWAEPLAVAGITAGALPAWTEHDIQQADHLYHPDVPVPAARSGYLQLHPAGQAAAPAAEGARP
ncbi:hypothetical protein [Streptomyces orinoci]|uniref:Uncharacterized protein n=1 Tax=Streptomyces orinoci TaxID=67339 RepID=A0ABV3JZ57_STRON